MSIFKDTVDLPVGILISKRESSPKNQKKEEQLHRKNKKGFQLKLLRHSQLTPPRFCSFLPKNEQMDFKREENTFSLLTQTKGRCTLWSEEKLYIDVFWFESTMIWYHSEWEHFLIETRVMGFEFKWTKCDWWILN